MLTNAKSAVQRPLVTFALFTYNHENYVRQAIESALEQTYEPLEIIVSDDASTDRTQSIISECLEGYSGPHKVTFNRNPSNLGLIGHINKVCNMARGDLIVVGAGDDISMPERVTEHASVFSQQNGKAHSIHSSVMKIDLDGNDIGLWDPPILKTGHSPDQLLFSLQTVIGASHSWSKELFLRFGDIQVRETYEDLVMVFRASLLSGVFYVDKPLVRYRIGSGISTTNLQPTESLEKLVRERHVRRLLLYTAKQRLIDCRVLREWRLASRLALSCFKSRLKLVVIDAQLLLRRYATR